MKRWLNMGLVAGFIALLTGCAATIRSDVTAFHDWPATLPDQSYVFERTKEQNDSLEYLSYENLVRAELHRFGFTEAAAGAKPAIKAMMRYDIRGRDVREVYPVVVNPYPYPYWYGPAWRGYYGPFYDPFWYGAPVVQQRVAQYQLFTRELRITLTRMPDGKRLHETTVVSEGTNGSLAAVMPYLVHSAFADFPGPNGVPRRIELKMQR